MHGDGLANPVWYHSVIDTNGFKHEFWAGTLPDGSLILKRSDCTEYATVDVLELIKVEKAA